MSIDPNIGAVALDDVTKWLSNGLPVSASIANAGIPTSTYHDWLRQAKVVRARVAANPSTVLTDDDLALLQFSAGVARAIAEGESRLALLLLKIAEGGVTQTRTRTKYDANGTMLERSVETWQTLPSERAIMFMLANRYGWGTAVATGEPADDDLSIEDQAGAVVSGLEELLAKNPGS